MPMFIFDVYHLKQINMSVDTVDSSCVGGGGGGEGVRVCWMDQLVCGNGNVDILDRRL